MSEFDKFEIAVIIPCLNEETTIRSVVTGFKAILPEATVYVYDNGSTDATIKFAGDAGAIVREVSTRGKGNVVKAMFRDVDADYYIIIDGDDTYPVASAVNMLSFAVENKTDMVVGSRIKTYKDSKSRRGHYLGNRLLTSFVNYLFKANYSDLLSGYRVMSRRFVKSAPLFAGGFEVESILSVHAAEVDAKVIEFPIQYLPRKDESSSKLNTLQDGFFIVIKIIDLFKDNRPKLFFGSAAVVFFLAGLLVGLPVISEFVSTHYVSRIPSAILATGLMIFSAISITAGVIIGAVSKARREIKKLAFLSLK